LWKGGVVEEINEKVQFIEENYDLLTAKIIARVQVIQEEQSEIMNGFGKQMLENKGAAFVK